MLDLKCSIETRFGVIGDLIMFTWNMMKGFKIELGIIKGKEEIELQRQRLPN